MAQALDRFGQGGYLIGKPPCVGLLGGEQASNRLQLILNHLQLVDRFLLGRFETLGLFDQLLGSLRGARLQLTDRSGPVPLRRGSRIGSPERDRSDACQQDQKRRGGKHDRLTAGPYGAVGSCLTRKFDHRVQSPNENEGLGTHAAKRPLVSIRKATPTLEKRRSDYAAKTRRKISDSSINPTKSRPASPKSSGPTGLLDKELYGPVAGAASVHVANAGGNCVADGASVTLSRKYLP